MVVLCATWWSLTAVAGAHATLLELSPAAEATLESAPGEVRLVFSEEIATTADSIRVFDPAAQEVRGVAAVANGVELAAALPPLTERGSYTVAWKVVSADGHAIRGAYLFHLGEATLSEPVDAGEATGTLLADALRALGAVLTLAGLVLCVTTGWRFRWVTVVLGTILAFIGSAVAVPAGASESIRVVLETTSGRSAMVAVLLASAGLAASLLPVHRRSELIVAGAVLPAVALQGHAVALDPILLSGTATVLHVLAAVGWLVGLVRMERRSRALDDELARSDARSFGRLGVTFVVVLLLSGVALVLARVSPGELVGSTYGRLAVVKTVLLLGAVAVAWRNRRLASRGDDATSGVAAALRSGLRLEMGALALALLAGAVLAQVPPPGEGGDVSEGGYFAERAAFGEGEVELTVDPGQRGVNEVHVTAVGSDGRLMAEAGELELSLELESEGIGPIVPDMQVISGGHSMAYVRIPFSGAWTATVRARVDQFTELSASLELPIGD